MKKKVFKIISILILWAVIAALYIIYVVEIHGVDNGCPYVPTFLFVALSMIVAKGIVHISQRKLSINL